MKDYTGDPEFPIWLLGDSPPKTHAKYLDTPLDPRHPARHNIWTSIVDVMQDKLFRKEGRRLDTSRLYIRNASDKSFLQPLSIDQFQAPAADLKLLLEKHKPYIVLTFGVSSFMVALYASGENPQRIYKTTEALGNEFRKRTVGIKDDGLNVIPLLHASIARRHFLKAHEFFTGGYGAMPQNYFDYAGTILASLILEELRDSSVWVNRSAPTSGRFSASEGAHSNDS